jgi:ubiquinone/menaquinone biosynthesis C-methylase UbiE
MTASSIYDRDYFLSDACEGYEDFLHDRLSSVRARELELLAAEPGHRVLDVACGRGDVVSHFVRHGITAIGIDYSAAAIALAAELVQPGTALARADATALPFPDGTFARILLGDVVEHLPWPSAVRMLREVGRTLAPDGVALIHTAPNKIFSTCVLPAAKHGFRLAGRTELADRIASYQERRPIVHPNELHPWSFRRLLREAGLGGTVWVDRDVLRGGASAWTGSLASSPAGRLAGRIAATPPLRSLLGNDLYALVPGASVARR